MDKVEAVAYRFRDSRLPYSGWNFTDEERSIPSLSKYEKHEPLYSQSAIDALQAEVERLADVAERRHDEMERLRDLALAAEARATRAEAEAAALRADAERWRWIRMRIAGAEHVTDELCQEYQGGERLAQEVDRTVDTMRELDERTAAMLEQPDGRG